MKSTHSKAVLAGVSALILAACSQNATNEEPEVTAGIASFDSLSYTGRDPMFERNPLEAGEYRNPILSGFYPDPSITEGPDGFYLVNSTFSWYPGIPVFHSKDLVNWTQVGNVIDRPGMLDFDGLGMSRGVFAPTIEYHEGVFYVANTCVDCGGNFIVTATDPAGPWSDPVWVPDVGGIDPSLFFDADGNVWLMNNDEPPGGSTYDGHRAVWIRQIDPETFQPITEPTVVVDGGARPEDKPIWIEGPHIYHVGDWYYFSAAEGGTAEGHSQVIFRSENVDGPYVPYDGNPIMTQRDLDPMAEDAVTSVGHADYVQDEAGNWWVVFLGTRPYNGYYYNTGRETFMLPVTWTEDGWPVILERGKRVPLTLPAPTFNTASETAARPTTGNFTITEEFDGEALGPEWMTMRVQDGEWYSLTEGTLRIEPNAESLGGTDNPSFIGFRQQHMAFDVTLDVSFIPAAPGDEAGLALIQSEQFHFAFGIGMNSEGESVLRLRRRAGSQMPENGEILAEVPLPESTSVTLKASADAGLIDFAYAVDGGDFISFVEDADNTILSTRTAGGFVGVVMGPYATSAE